MYLYDYQRAVKASASLRIIYIALIIQLCQSKHIYGNTLIVLNKVL